MLYVYVLPVWPRLVTFLQNCIFFRISEKFELVEKRALKVPKNTEELLLLGKYMLYCNTRFMTLIKEDILEMIWIFNNLLDFRSVSEQHIKLNAVAINWLKDIIPVYKENSSVSI